MRKSFSADFKAKVAIEAVKGVKTLSELSGLYQVHPNQISNWKKQFLEGATAFFGFCKNGRKANGRGDEQSLPQNRTVGNRE